MLAQPAAPDLVVGPARRDEVPEARPVAEHAQVRQLVDDDRLERFGRGEDEPPREREPALRGEALPQRVRWSRMLTAVGVTPSAPAWRAMSRSIAARARGLSHASRTAAIDRRSAGRHVDDDLVLVGAADPLDA